MSYYEFLSIIISCLAALISLIVWSGQRKLTRESNDLQKATAELAKKQLDILLREEKGKNTARLALSLVKENNSSYKFYLRNVSDVDATEVEFRILTQDSSDNPIVEDDYKSKFPLRRLAPGMEITTHAAIYLSSSGAYNAVLRWKNPDGSQSEDETFVSI